MHQMEAKEKCTEKNTMYLVVPHFESMDESKIDKWLKNEY